MAKLNSFRELKVYQKLKALHLEVHRETLRFPKFETYELGSQVRRSSNSAPALGCEDRIAYGTERNEPSWSEAVPITKTGTVK